MAKGFGKFLACVALTAATGLAVTNVAAKSADGARDDTGQRRFIVLFEDPPLAEYLSAERRARLQAPRQPTAVAARRSRLDAKSTESRAYLRELDARFEGFKGEARARMGRDLKVVHRYRHALNGFSASLSDAEARQLRAMPGVRLVQRDQVFKLHSDSGPQWIGADEIWFGQGVPIRRGEDVVVGVIDSGINWEHPSFLDPGGIGSHDHTNPFGQELGLCSDPDVECNDKLVGVWDFVEDDPGTPETEEFNNGFDNTNHGSLSASVAAGNPLNAIFNGRTISPSGVAPNANIVSYRVCYTDDPDDETDNLCQNSAIVQAIDQGIADGVDVINLSLGGDAVSPWNNPTSIALLNAFDAGIFVATSSGNLGLLGIPIGGPGNAPWTSAVGAATHDRLFASPLNVFQGGDTDPPGTLYGSSFSTETAGPADIVHAKDFGNALCGTGPTENDSGRVECGELTGSSNPFPPGTFNGEIVVCDRGTYGRIEKGNNLLQAGAGGYVLANTSAQGEQVNSDSHCLASSHLGQADADVLRAWLDSGSGHTASITGFNIVHLPEVGDILAGFSSRGPNLPPVEDILKPNLIAPGVAILAAGNEGNSLFFADGTSFSSPHIAGAAALLKSVDPDLTPSMIGSKLELTATPEQVVLENGQTANPHERGAGRPQLGEAANSAIFLEETTQNFFAANPAQGGEPKTLNLPSMTDADCAGVCSFTRTVSPLVGGVTWNAKTSGFPEGVIATVKPKNFTLNAGTNRVLSVDVDLRGGNALKEWVYGQVELTTPNFPDAVMPVAVFASGGLASDFNGGWQELPVSGLAALPQASYQAGGLVAPTNTTMDLLEDTTEDFPYDGSQGTFTVLHEVPEDALWLYAETLASVSVDVDLYVGRDTNGDGVAQAFEEVCSSTTPDDLEQCDILTPQAGTWWVLVQNWDDGLAGSNTEQEVTLLSAVVGGENDPSLTATGPGIVGPGEVFKVRLSWDNVSAVTGDQLLGALGIGSSHSTPNNVEVIPFTFDRTGISVAETLALFDGRPLGLALEVGQSHERIFIDVPEGASSLNVEVKGLNANQTNGLEVEIGRVDFDDAFTAAPFVPGFGEITTSKASGLVTAQSITQEGGTSMQIELSGDDLQPGRHYVVVTNNGARAASVTVQADLEFEAEQIPYHAGLYEPTSRPDIKQGFEYNGGANSRAVIWYTYTEDNVPTWFLSSGATQDGNVWTSDLFRFTNDGSDQASTLVGSVSMTLISTQDVIFTWTLFGQSGSDRTRPISPHQCAEIDGESLSTTGLWYRGVDGLGGATVLMNAGFQAQVHYLYDDTGTPFWLFSSALAGPDEIPLLQWTGFCPICEGEAFTEEVGVLGVGFTSDTTGSWTLDYVANPPLSSDVTRTDQIVKITETLPCE